MKFSVLLVSSVYIVSRCVMGEYEYQMETIEYVYPVNFAPNLQHSLKRLGLAERQQMCTTAKNRVSADWANTQKVLMRVNVLGVVYSNGLNVPRTTLICPTIPRLYLRVAAYLSGAMKTIKIMERRNEYMESNYNFFVEPIKFLEYRGEISAESTDAPSSSGSSNSGPSIGLSPPSSSTPLPFPDNSSYQRLKMCVAAKRRLEALRITLLHEEWIDGPKKYRIVTQSGNQTDIVAIKCNSRPVIHLRSRGESTPPIGIVVVIWEGHVPQILLSSLRSRSQ